MGNFLYFFVFPRNSICDLTENGNLNFSVFSFDTFFIKQFFIDFDTHWNASTKSYLEKYLNTLKNNST